METDIHIHHDFTQYSDFIHSIPTYTYPVDKVFCNNRNIVELTHVGNIRLVIKKYQIPILINRIAYTFFRKSKAQRAYENAFILNNLNIPTATPVAYIIQKEWGLLRNAWFVSAYIPHIPLIEYYQNQENKPYLDLLWKDLGQFMLHVHLSGIHFQDNNGGNILVKRNTKSFQFFVVDINRLDRGKVPSLEKSMRSFAQLGMDGYTLLSPLSYYADARQFDLNFCMERVSHYRKQRSKQIYCRQIIRKLRLMGTG